MVDTTTPQIDGSDPGKDIYLGGAVGSFKMMASLTSELLSFVIARRGRDCEVGRVRV